jgi:hypothetical protein
MTHNLTENQQALAKWLVAERQAGRIDEFFSVTTDAYGRAMLRDSSRFPFNEEGARTLLLDCPSFTEASLDALVAEGMLLSERRAKAVRRFTFRRRILDAVRNDFRELPALPQIIAGTQHSPPEITLSLERLRRKHPDPARLGFLMAPPTQDRMSEAIVRTIIKTAARHEISILSPEGQFHADLWTNVRTLLHGCSFGIAIYEYAGGEEPRVNAGIEIGYLLALNKPVLLLQGRNVAEQPEDLMARFCVDFDEHDPAQTIPEQFERWLMNNGVIVPQSGV